MTLDEETHSALGLASRVEGWLSDSPLHYVGHGGADADYKREWRRLNPELDAEINERRAATLRRVRRERWHRIVAVIAPFVVMTLIARAIHLRAAEVAARRKWRAGADAELLREMNRRHQAARRARLREAGLTARATARAA